ncbi:xylem NAC domain 1 [Perilla frutescens var. frutescens]|nr:xylem NAC domain 1 [Perilla frutescens var. frutescens]
MPKKQQHFSWRQARDDELGFMAATDPTDFAENSEAGNQRRNVMGNSRNPNLIVEPPRNSNSIGEQPRHQNQIVEPPPNMHSHTEPRGHQHDSLDNEVTVNRIQANDELYIAPSEHSGMCLTADSFDGRNFHIWCRAVKRGLISRNKLRIINSSIPPPRADSVDYMQWLKVDYLVFNWISNSMNKEIARGFQHLDTSSQLWDELYKRFGSRNGPRLYQLRREIATYSQQNQSVMLYFNNLTSLWDDLALLKNSRVCTCEAAADATTDLEEEHLMQFLMGLQDCYETINVSNHLAGGIDHTALYSNQKPYRGEPYKKRLSKEEKAKLRCEHCGGSGHVKSDCFDLIGVPEWYKKYRNDKGKGRAHYAAKKEDEGKSVDETEVRSQMDLSADTISGVSKLIQMQTDLAKQFQQMFRKGPKWEDSAAEGPPNLANLTELDLGSSSIDFKGGGHYAFGVSTAITNEEWIVDSGASHHMSCNIGLLTDMKRLKHPLQVFLLDGSSVWVFLAGEANLNRDITLHNRLNSEAVLGICKMKKYLYVFPQQPVVSCIANTVEIGSEILELHRLLGHPSLTTMKHIMSGKKRGDKCIFLGVSSQHKGYILYNLSFENSYTPTDYVSDGIPTQESSLSDVDQLFHTQLHQKLSTQLQKRLLLISQKVNLTLRLRGAVEEQQVTCIHAKICPRVSVWKHGPQAGVKIAVDILTSWITICNRSMGDKKLNLPPGFRFYPTDEELLVHFLQRKAALLPCHPDVIPDLDLYPYDPWDLDGKAMCEGKKWYYYSRRTSNRISESGYWQSIGVEDPIYSSTGGGLKLIGIKKYCAFYIGQPSQGGVKTNWIMHEYKVSNSSSSSRKKNHSKNNIDHSKWVLCRVFERHDDDDDDGGTELSCLDEVFLSLDDFDEISLPN